MKNQGSTSSLYAEAQAWLADDWNRVVATLGEKARIFYGTRIALCASMLIRNSIAIHRSPVRFRTLILAVLFAAAGGSLEGCAVYELAEGCKDFGSQV